MWKEFKRKIKIHFPNKIRATDKYFLRPKFALYWEERGEKGELTAKHDIFIPKKTHRNVTIYIKTRLKKEIV